MISKKERRIQKALGTEDGMPPTIYKYILFHCRGVWWKYITMNLYKYTWTAFYQWLAFKLPKKLVYHCAIRVWAYATTCSSGRKENACITTMSDAIKRWEKE